MRREQRFTRDRPCPVCGGCDRDARGQGKRCIGFRSEDGDWCHCSREEHAGDAPFNEKSGCYVHRLHGPCKCGARHGPDKPFGGSGSSESATKSRIVAGYDYRDNTGTARYQVVRYDPKGFKQRRPDGSGGWIWNLQGVDPVPYRLPELLAADPAEPILWCEGEKDCDNLSARRFVASTSAMGAKSWNDAISDHVPDNRSIVMLPDNDPDGETYLAKVATSFAKRGHVVRVLRLPNLAPKGDVSDWLEAGRTDEQLRALIAAAPAWEPPDERLSAHMAFPADVFPEPLRRHAEAAARAIQVPVSFIALALLVGAGAVVGRTRRLVVQPGFEVLPILWGATVAWPGVGKSPAHKAGISPVYALQDAAEDRYKLALAEYERELAAWSSDPERKKSGDKPQPPVMERFWTSDATKEALAPLCQQSAGVMIFRDELTALVEGFGSYKKNGGGDRQDMLSMWNGSRITVDRKGAPPIIVKNPVVPVLGGIQPDLLPKLANELGADGFLDRFLFDFPDAPRRRWARGNGFNATPSPEVMAIFERLRRHAAHAADTNTTCLAPDALDLFIDWANDIEEQCERFTKSGQPALAGVYAKLTIQLAAVTLILHCLHETDDPSRMVSRARLADGIEVVDYFREQAHRVLARFGALAEPRFVGMPGRVQAALLKAAPDGWTPRKRLYELLGNNVAATDLTTALLTLEMAGKVESRTVPTAGRPSEQWRVSPPTLREQTSKDEQSPLAEPEPEESPPFVHVPSLVRADESENDTAALVDRPFPDETTSAEGPCGRAACSDAHGGCFNPGFCPFGREGRAA